MKTVTSPRYTASHPFAVVSRFGDIVSTHCCANRAAEDRSRHLGAEVAELRPLPTKGAHGGWRFATETRGPCKCAAQMSVEDWPAA